jgi:hypothetical protein
MRQARGRWIRGVVGGAVAVLAIGAAAVGAQANGGAPLWAGPPGGIVPLREAGQGTGNGAGKKRTSQVKMLAYHNGPVITDPKGTAVTAIFWGSSWGTSPGDKITGIDAFYGGIGGTSYMHSNSEYTQTGGAHVSTVVSYGGHAVDTAAAPTRAPSTTTVLAEVGKLIKNPVPNGYYPVYIDQPRGTAGYCAWHSYGQVNGVGVQFAFFFKLDGDAGCDPKDTSGLHSQGLAALANVSGHELSETVTDPQLNAWYDSSGAENSDKCAWTFGPLPLSFGGTSWKIQGNWSNAAYGTGQSYLGSSSGCIDHS